MAGRVGPWLAVGVAVVGLGAASGASGAAPPARTLAANTVPARTLAANGLLGLRLGVNEVTAVGRVASIAGHAPALSDAGGVDCGVDAATWAGLTLDIVHGKLAGYTYSASGTDKLAGLTTATGLRVGDSTSAARRLYGAELTTSWAQAGSYAIHTAQGRLAGYLKATSKPDSTDTPAGRIVTIGAGDEGCPAASP